jgi:hypothetical protein
MCVRYRLNKTDRLYGPIACSILNRGQVFDAAIAKNPAEVRTQLGIFVSVNMLVKFSVKKLILYWFEIVTDETIHSKNNSMLGVFDGG